MNKVFMECRYGGECTCIDYNACRYCRHNPNYDSTLGYALATQEVEQADKKRLGLLQQGICTECDSLRSMKKQGHFELWKYCPHCGKEL